MFLSNKGQNKMRFLHFFLYLILNRPSCKFSVLFCLICLFFLTNFLGRTHTGSSKVFFPPSFSYFSNSYLSYSFNRRLYLKPHFGLTSIRVKIRNSVTFPYFQMMSTKNCFAFLFCSSTIKTTTIYKYISRFL